MSREREPIARTKKPSKHGITLDEKAQEQPVDKSRAQQPSRTDHGDDPPGDKEANRG